MQKIEEIHEQSYLPYTLEKRLLSQEHETKIQKLPLIIKTLGLEIVINQAPVQLKRGACFHFITTLI